MTAPVAVYDSEASTYDSARFYSSLGRHFDYLHKRIVESLLNSSNKRLLEIGIGTGRFGTWLATKGFNVVGMDISKEMLKKASEKARLMGVELDFVIADVQHVPFCDDAFGNCLCVNVMDHFSDYTGFFKQVKKIIKQDGNFVFNFSNAQSPYLPIATVIKFSKHALFKGEIFSKWSTLKEIKISLSKAQFQVKETRGFMITSQIPSGDAVISIAKIINFASEKSVLRYFSGSIFVKANKIQKNL